MMFRRLSLVGGSSPKQEPSSHNLHIFSKPTTIVNLFPWAKRTNSAEASGQRDPKGTQVPARGWTSDLLQLRKPKQHSSKIKLGPSGAVVFNARQSLESTVSTPSVVESMVLTL